MAMQPITEDAQRDAATATHDLLCALEQWSSLTRMSAWLAWLLVSVALADALLGVKALWLAAHGAPALARFGVWLVCITLGVATALFTIAWRFKCAAERLVWRRLRAVETQALSAALATFVDLDAQTDRALLAHLNDLDGLNDTVNTSDADDRHDADEEGDDPYGPDGDFTILDTTD